MKTLNTQIYHATLRVGAALPFLSENMNPPCQELVLNSSDVADLKGE